MYFIKIDSFYPMDFLHKSSIEEMEHYQHNSLNGQITNFVGFDSSVCYFDKQDDKYLSFIQSKINDSCKKLELYSEQHNNCYSIVPVCIITTGYVGINCYREDEKTLYMYDLSRYSDNLFSKKIDSLVNLDFYKMIHPKLEEMIKNTNKNN